MPPLRLEARDFDVEHYLWNAQETSSARNSDPRVDSIFSNPSGETFLMGIQEQEQIQLTGRATGFRLARHGDFSDDPLQALAEWCATLQSFVNGQQGTGRMLTNEYTGRSLQGVVEEVTINRERSEKYEAGWELTYRVGRGLMPFRSPETPDVNPQPIARVAGQDLGDVEQLRDTITQQYEVHAFVHHDVEDNGIEAQTGATREIMIIGSKPGPERERAEFDAIIRENIGENVIAEYEEAFPGQTTDVMITDFESSREAGITDLGEYTMTLVEGQLGSAGTDPIESVDDLPDFDYDDIYNDDEDE